MKINQNWKFEYNGEALSATVPGCIHTDLLNHKIIEDPFYSDNEKRVQWVDKREWTYNTNFFVPDEEFLKEKKILVFHGLDTLCSVYLNDVEIGRFNNMFREHRVDVSQKLKLGENSLKIIFHSVIEEGRKKIKDLGYNLPAINDLSAIGEIEDNKVSIHYRKAPYQFGWDWGPRIVTAGIWKDIEPLAFNGINIENVYFHQKDISITQGNIDIIAEVESVIESSECIKFLVDGEEVYRADNNFNVGENKIKFSYQLENPKLWWPNGFGEQYLYTFELVVGDKSVIKKIGLRKIELVRERDNYGESFLFKVNGHEIFMKGANHIPSDIFITRVDKKRVEREIISAKHSNFNMLRVWGGGVYENEDFYDLCDEHGILVWQDFMFACSMYPGDEEFLKEIKLEAEYNIRRLRDRTSLALWCGNNEIDVAWSAHYNHGWGWKALYDKDTKDYLDRTYEKIFYELLDECVKENDLSTKYWPSSPWSGDKNIHADWNSTTGDMHFWGVWHMKMDFSAFEKHPARFMSEYGMQSFPDVKLLEEVTPKGEMELFSNSMTWHQRSGNGNELIKHYLNEYFVVPEDFSRFVFLSQLMQAEAIRSAIESHRRIKPYCMGSLYWQMNDTWIGPSWSSLDYYGNWKPLQYFAKEACKDIIVGVKDEEFAIHLSILNDTLYSGKGTITIESKKMNGEVCYTEENQIDIDANCSTYYKSISKVNLAQGNTYGEIYVKMTLVYGEERYERYLFLNKLSEMSFKDETISLEYENRENNHILTLKADSFSPYVKISADKAGFFSDNILFLERDREYKVKFYPYEKVETLNFSIEKY